MNCDISGCTQPAYHRAHWGSDSIPNQVANLCRKHGLELWERLNPLLQINRVWYWNDEPLETEIIPPLTKPGCTS